LDLDIRTSPEWVEAFDLYRKLVLITGDGLTAAEQLNEFFHGDVDAMAVTELGPARQI
jgi:hypothetical protein